MPNLYKYKTDIIFENLNYIITLLIFQISRLYNDIIKELLNNNNYYKNNQQILIIRNIQENWQDGKMVKILKWDFISEGNSGNKRNETIKFRYHLQEKTKLNENFISALID